MTHMFCALAFLVPRETGPQGKTRRGSEESSVFSQPFRGQERPFLFFSLYAGE